MGCCFGKDDEKDYGSGEPDETSRLINPVSEQQSRNINGEHFTNADVESQPKGDDQSALSSIVHKIARDVIDVAAIEGGGMEQHEFHDKARQYSNRVTMVLSNGSSRQQLQKSQLPKGVPSSFTVLNSNPISIGDIDLICNVSEKALKSVKQVNVEHKEDLVVPFRVP